MRGVLHRVGFSFAALALSAIALRAQNGYELGQLYRKMGRPADAHAALVKFQQLRQAADREKNKEVEDWRKLNVANRQSSSADAPDAPAQ